MRNITEMCMDEGYDEESFKKELVDTFFAYLSLEFEKKDCTGVEIIGPDVGDKVIRIEANIY